MRRLAFIEPDEGRGAALTGSPLCIRRFGSSRRRFSRAPRFPAMTLSDTPALAHRPRAADMRKAMHGERAAIRLPLRANGTRFTAILRVFLTPRKWVAAISREVITRTNFGAPPRLPKGALWNESSHLRPSRLFASLVMSQNWATKLLSQFYCRDVRFFQ